ncbi:hypothetical protein [Helicobacter sp. 13S00477-4]|uniref:hypothetical protein n=1 Tax=Helicobacter sp. 13S00477-4 TaxID=1905759 RepID=UPI000BA69760|nr:hypothetical protein [Helicobacter sp. 13S00477-4]PAF52083.1 hypothetical protein BKH44_04220 [Helicobacter sp. 13S00477-4]
MLSYRLLLVIFIIAQLHPNELEDSLKNGYKEEHFLASNELPKNHYYFGLGVGIVHPHSMGDNIKDKKKFDFKSQFQNINIGPFLDDSFLKDHIPYNHNHSIGVSIGFGSKESARGIALKAKYKEEKQQKIKQAQKYRERQKQQQIQSQIENLLEDRKIIILTKGEQTKAKKESKGYMPKKGLYLQIAVLNHADMNIQSILKGYDFKIYSKGKINRYLLGPFANLLEIVAIKNTADSFAKEFEHNDKAQAILYEVK